MCALTSLILLLGVTDITYRSEFKDHARIDFRQFNGTWKVIHLMDAKDDYAWLLDTQENIWHLDGNKARMNDGQHHVEITFPPPVDPDFQDPRAIDIESMEHPRRFKGICSIKNGELVIAVSIPSDDPPLEPGVNRPKTFDVTQPGVTILVLKKVR